eukprot:1145647-Pelagomonas_calceolata.AAC.9
MYCMLRPYDGSQLTSFPQLSKQRSLFSSPPHAHGRTSPRAYDEGCPRGTQEETASTDCALKKLQHAQEKVGRDFFNVDLPLGGQGSGLRTGIEHNYELCTPGMPCSDGGTRNQGMHIQVGGLQEDRNCITTVCSSRIVVQEVGGNSGVMDHG